MKTIHTKHAPAAIGPYSQAVRAGGFVFLSGQIGIVPEKGTLISCYRSLFASRTGRRICIFIRPNRNCSRKRNSHFFRFERTGRTGLPEYRSCFKKSGALHGKRNQNNLLFNRYGQFFSFQRSLCTALHFKACQKLCRCDGTSCRRSL